MTTLLLTLSHCSRGGGEERYGRAFADALASSGEAVAVVGLWDPIGRDRSAAAHAPGAGGSRLRMTAATVRLLLTGRPETVVLGHVLLLPLAVLARLLRPRAPIVLLVYGLEVWDRPSRIRRMLIDRFVDRIVAVSPYTARRMAASHRLPQDRFVVVTPPAPPASAMRPLRARGATILSVSRLGAHTKGKGIQDMIAALPAVAEQVPDARYIIAGDGSDRRRLEGLAAAAGVAGRVDFAGAVSDEALERMYRDADVFVLPSSQEGFGIVFLEAFAHAVPVVAADAGAAGDVVRGRGLLVPPGDPQSLAAAVARLLTESALRASCAAAGLQAVEGTFSQETFIAAANAVVQIGRGGDRLDALEGLAR